MFVPDDATILQILNTSKRIAIVGLSDNPSRDSNRVAVYLQAHGYEIIPINPQLPEILGVKSYPSLAAVPGQIDIVDVFRRPEFVPEIVESTISVHAPVLWLQLGVVHAEAAARAEAAGIRVVMDRCIKIEHYRLLNK